jgi:hypothetical protein
MLARNQAIVQILCAVLYPAARPTHSLMCNPTARRNLSNYPRINSMHGSSIAYEGNSFPYAPRDYPRAAVFKFTGFNRSFTDQFESIPILTPALMRGGNPGQKETKCVMNWPP